MTRPAIMPSRRYARLRRALAALPLILALDVRAGVASAQTMSPNAERLFSEGLKLAHAGDCVHARDKFTESYGIDPAPGTLINWALCEEKLGRSATALELLRLADQTLPANHPKRAGMVKHIELLTKRAPLLRLRATAPLPTGTTATLDGALLEASAFSSGVLGDPGNRILELKAPGRDNRRYEITLAEGTTLEVTVEPGPPLAEASKATNGAQETGTSPTAGTADSARTLGWALGAGGVAVLGAGIVTGLLAKDKWEIVKSDCDIEQSVCRTDEGVRASSAGTTLAAVSTASFILGGASLAVGGYLLLTRKDAPATARLSAAAGPTTVGLRLGGEF